ncbi:MAG: patatin-like phospholipase family protein [Bacteroidales bacterium]|nr:patatin-like phospholipase family protein [Bacteroidales bacterium]
MKKSNIKQPVSLVLSSGGARGIAHIGVIEILENQDFEIKSISGASMGALIGGIYAAGKLKEYKEWISGLKKIDVLKMFDFTLSKYGLVKGNKVFKEMEKIVPNINIEDMDITFTAIATDILKRKEMIFNSGKLFDAIRASIAIPSVFTPLIINNSQLVDGGVVNPIPINRVKRTPGDIIVAVNVGANIPIEYPKISHSEQNEKQTDNEISEIINTVLKKIFRVKQTKNTKNTLGYFELISETMNTMLQRLTEMSIEYNKPDILINISRHSCGTFDFYKADKMIKIGREETLKSIKNYREKK